MYISPRNLHIPISVHKINHLAQNTIFWHRKHDCTQKAWYNEKVKDIYQVEQWGFT